MDRRRVLVEVVLEVARSHPGDRVVLPLADFDAVIAKPNVDVGNSHVSFLMIGESNEMWRGEQGDSDDCGETGDDGKQPA